MTARVMTFPTPDDWGALRSEFWPDECHVAPDPPPHSLCPTAAAIMSDWTRTLLRITAGRGRALSGSDWRRAAELRYAGHTPYAAAAVLLDGDEL